MAEIMAYVEFLADDLDAICRRAFTMYSGHDPEVLLEHDPRAAAACIYAHMAFDAEQRFAALYPKVQPLDPRPLGGLKIWRVGDPGADALLRLKNMTRTAIPVITLLAKPGNTIAVKLCPGLPPEAARLSVGYLLDATATVFVRTQIARPLARRIDWCAALVPQEERQVGEAVWVDVTRQRPL